MPRKKAPHQGKTPAPDRAPSDAGSPANPTPGIDALAAQIGAMVPASLDDIVRANRHLLRISLATPEQITEMAASVPRGPGRHTLSGWYVIGFETAADRALFLLGRTETGQTWLTSPIRAIDLASGMVETGNSIYVLDLDRRGVGEPDAELLILICVSLRTQGLGTVLGIAEWSY